RSGARLRSPAQRQHQRAGDRERDLRRRSGRGRADQPGRCAIRRAAARHPAGEQRYPRSAPGKNMSADTTVHRIFNFAAGPAVLPVPVLEEIQRDLVALPGVGMSVLEISHRSKTFESILARAEADIRTLAGMPPNYRVLFLQGGASLQFSMVPMNLLTAGGTPDSIAWGSSGRKARTAAKQFG